MEAFIMENLLEKRVTINCGSNNLFTGIIKNCLNKVIFLEVNSNESENTESKHHNLIYINVDKIISIKVIE